MFTRLRRLKRSALQLLRNQRTLDDIKFNQGYLLSSLQSPDGSLPLNNFEFKIFSQWGEDGIIQYLVNNLDIANHTFIEFGVEDFFESNCRFLMMKDQWQGFVIDGSVKKINSLKKATSTGDTGYVPKPHSSLLKIFLLPLPVVVLVKSWACYL